MILSTHSTVDQRFSLSPHGHLVVLRGHPVTLVALADVVSMKVGWGDHGSGGNGRFSRLLVNILVPLFRGSRFRCWFYVLGFSLLMLRFRLFFSRPRLLGVRPKRLISPRRLEKLFTQTLNGFEGFGFQIYFRKTSQVRVPTSCRPH